MNDVCIVLRNLNVGDGLTNNTRVRIHKIYDNIIIAQRIVPPHEMLALPRIRFHFRLPFSQSYEMVRSQFPLRRAFALTYNKSQGQTLDKVLLDVRDHLFNHGYLYVGMSRVQVYNQIAFYVQGQQMAPAHDDIEPGCIIGNIVYQSML